MKTTSNALDIIKRLTGDEPSVRRALRQAHLNFDIAELIHDARTAAGLTQRELAELAETRQSVIARLEDADYEGHSLSMLQRIAGALGLLVKVQFAPLAAKDQPRHERVTTGKRATGSGSPRRRAVRRIA